MSYITYPIDTIIFKWKTGTLLWWFFKFKRVKKCCFNEGLLIVINDGVALPHVQLICGVCSVADSVATHENGRVGGLYWAPVPALGPALPINLYACGWSLNRFLLLRDAFKKM